jgi:hypothetical protein
MHDAQVMKVWENRLRHAAGDVRVAASELSDFRDDAGHRRKVDPWLLAHAYGLDARDIRVDEIAAVQEPWVALWMSVHDAARDVGTWRAGRGPLFPHLHSRAIEVWTEGELAGLHALWWLAHRDATLAPRARSAAAWLIAELQPDNATQRPWALHAFAQLAAEGDIEADMYAQTLLLNATAGREKPDRFSAAIAIDAANYLRDVHAAQR